MGKSIEGAKMAREVGWGSEAPGKLERVYLLFGDKIK